MHKLTFSVSSDLLIDHSVFNSMGTISVKVNIDCTRRSSDIDDFHTGRKKAVATNWLSEFDEQGADTGAGGDDVDTVRGKS